MERIGDYPVAISKINIDNPAHLRDLAFRVRSRFPNVCLILGAEIEGKAHLGILLADSLVEKGDLNASAMIREVASEIQGGGGGQPFFATAGGKNPAGLEKALEKAKKIMIEALS